MRIQHFSSWLLLAAAASTTAFAPRSVLSTKVTNTNATCSAENLAQGTCISNGSSNTALKMSSAVAEIEAKPVEIFRKDYKPLDLVVEKINMDFDIRDGTTIVKSELFIEKNPKMDWNPDENHDLILDGDETCVTLLEVSLDGRVLVEGEDYTLAPGTMVVKNPPPGSVLTTKVSIVPEDNTQLSGLYRSGPMYCTQCEAMGFRRITYYPDRPDNMAVFERIRLEANKQDYPMLLANGNLVEEGPVDEDDRHYAVWTDPYPKPSYLFCCVAGNLGKITDSYTTVPSGRKVELNIYSDPKDAHKLQYAMESLKNSMKWDEDTYGLEYDLDLYNIVAVDSFNMGAMENKGLNVFNTAYVLADPSTATDSDYERVEGVIGHEYFHNWTGNRVTCRDWFQLTLKEGLTVFRDQEFSGDMNSKAVKRIESVVSLRAAQFSQDAGPMQHPIRPDSYISMDNFYTATVYNKGAEIIRMYHTILGADGFRKGMDLYFERHDGDAVTCDDFLSAMSDANDGADLQQFASWYSRPGTPIVTYQHQYDPETKKFTLTLGQSSSEASPLHIPISIGLLDKTTGEEVLATTVLDLKEETQVFEFENLEREVVPSLLRQFSAPVKLVPANNAPVDEELLAFLAARDTDGFNKWESGQALARSLIFQVMNGSGNAVDDLASTTWTSVKEAFERTITDTDSTDFSVLAYALTLPTEGTLQEFVDKGTPVDPLAIHNARGAVKKALAREFKAALQERYDALTEDMAKEEEFKVDAVSIGTRKLRNTCLEYLCAIRSPDNQDEQAAAAALAKSHYESAICMTDKVAALNALASMDGKGSEARDEIVQRFYDEANGDALVLDKWFAIQAMADLPDILDRVKALKEHPDFTLVNPNRCRSLVGGFSANSAGFHAESGEGYEFMRKVLEELDPLNPQISGRLSSSLITWKKYDDERGAKMKGELQKLSELKPISDDLFEIVSRGLQD
eukprot:CAMPEP_0168178254 /NCGR_PEP_ID=MMETSP0139_2-20121125/8993_1 /TAXON_ID=44445 /ORGANISM="Pseudo-nitzschia australis, Strain 10249 10 AB" /LENGTH=965 /DNA_ID=CAMNT_0008097567 /DNA_START=218 /DNA_END=3115 /DNA_ORIENTATION=-